MTIEWLYISQTIFISVQINIVSMQNYKDQQFYRIDQSSHNPSTSSFRKKVKQDHNLNTEKAIVLYQNMAVFKQDISKSSRDYIAPQSIQKLTFSNNNSSYHQIATFREGCEQVKSSSVIENRQDMQRASKAYTQYSKNQCTKRRNSKIVETHQYQLYESIIAVLEKENKDLKYQNLYLQKHNKKLRKQLNLSETNSSEQIEQIKQLERNIQELTEINSAYLTQIQDLKKLIINQFQRIQDIELNKIIVQNQSNFLNDLYQQNKQIHLKNEDSSSSKENRAKISCQQNDSTQSKTSSDSLKVVFQGIQSVQSELVNFKNKCNQCSTQQSIPNKDLTSSQENSLTQSIVAKLIIPETNKSKRNEKQNSKRQTYFSKNIKD